MIEIFTHDFMIKAFVIGYACAIAGAFLGNFLVASRQAIMSEMLAHTSLAGVGLGVLLGVSPNIAAVGVALASALMLYGLSRKQKISKDALSVLILSGGMSLALIFIHMAKDNPVALETFLFGSILTTTTTEMIIFLCVSLAIVVSLVIFYNRFVALTFDKVFFQSRFSFSAGFEIMLMLMVGILVALSLKIIGALLVSSLLVIPVLASQQIARSFRSSIWWSIGISIVGVTIGIITSFYVDVPTGPSIVLSLIFIFLLLLVVGRK